MLHQPGTGYDRSMPHRLGEVTVRGRTIRWRETDPVAPRGGHVEALVLLHAFPLSAAMWESQFDVCPGWRVVAPDLRGFRGPDGPAVEPPGELNMLTMDDLAEDVEHVLDALGPPTAVIGGLSMGGYLSFALLRRAPQRFRGLVLADTRATPDSEAGMAGRRAMQALADSGGAEAVADDMVPKLLGQSTRQDRPDLMRHVRALVEANSPGAIKGALGAMMTRPDARPLLAGVGCPTLILVGEEDTLTPIADSDQMRAAIRGSEFVRIRRAGHLSNLEQPEAFNTALSRFLRTTFQS